MARPIVIDAVRVKRNCFSFPFIAAPPCQTGPRAATITFCRFSGGFAPSPERERAERPSGQARREPERDSGANRAVKGHKGVNEIVMF